MNGARLAAIRQGKGLSQSELARRSGIDVTIINRIEHSQTRNLTRNTYFKLAKALDMPIEILFAALEAAEPVAA